MSSKSSFKEKGAGGWAALILWSVVFLCSAFFTRQITHEPHLFPAPQQLLVILVHTLAICGLLLLFMEKIGVKDPPRARDWDFYLPVAVLALVWGRLNFVNFFYYDEFARFSEIHSVTGFNPALFFNPVNDHFQPVVKLFWYLVYSTFRGDYFGVACTGWILAVAIVVTVQLLLKQLVKQSATFAVLVVSSAVAATEHSHTVILWKGAGDTLMLSLLLFLMCLLALLRHLDSQRTGVTQIVVLNLLTVFSSSQLTLVPIYLLPLGLWVWVTFGAQSEERRLFKKAYLWSIGITAVYWLMRRYVAGVHLPERKLSLADVGGALWGAFDVYFSRPSAVYTLLICCGVFACYIGYHLLRGRERSMDRLAVLWGSGVAMFLFGVAQLIAARRMTFASRHQLSGYHLYLAEWGITLLCAAMLLFALLRFDRQILAKVRPALRYCVLLMVVGFSSGYVYSQYDMVQRESPIADSFPLHWGVFNYPLRVPPGITKYSVISKRREFYRDLEELIASQRRSGGASAYLPDIPLTVSPEFEKLAFWAVFLNTDPSTAGWIGAANLSYQRLLLSGPENSGNDVRFKPPAEFSREELAAVMGQEHVARFYRKYWPGYDWSLRRPENRL